VSTKPSDLAGLVLLSAIWGASFLFMRVAAPDFGPVPLILVRVSVAGACLTPLLLSSGNRDALCRAKWRVAAVGVVNSAIPFSLLAYATLSLEAGFVALLNATTPIFAAIIGVVWLRTSLRRSQLAGMAIGFLGVAVVAWGRLSFKEGGAGWAILAVLLASSCYGLTANYVKTHMSDVSAPVVSVGSLLGATAVLIPIGLWRWPTESVPAGSWAAAGGLAVVCTSFAYLIYFRIIARAGATAATSVTFLIPIFAALWGALFLDEAVTFAIVAGMALTLAGTALTAGVLPLRGVQRVPDGNATRPVMQAETPEEAPEP